MIASVTCPWCREESHRNGEACPVALHPCCHEMPHAEWCPMADRPNPENNQSAAGAPEAKASNDAGFRDAEAPGIQTMDALGERMREEMMFGTHPTADEPAFELRWVQLDTGRIAWRWLIWANGRHQGFAENAIEGLGFGLLVTFNRIPALLVEARRDQERRVYDVVKLPLRPTLLWDGIALGFVFGAFVASMGFLLVFR